MISIRSVCRALHNVLLEYKRICDEWPFCTTNLLPTTVIIITSFKVLTQGLLANSDFIGSTVTYWKTGLYNKFALLNGVQQQDGTYIHIEWYIIQVADVNHFQTIIQWKPRYIIYMLTERYDEHILAYWDISHKQLSTEYHLISTMTGHPDIWILIEL